MPHTLVPARWRRAVAATMLAIGIVCAAAPATAAPGQEPPVELPAPPVTVQDLVNELLPLIRQLQPITDQVGPLLAQLDPLLAQVGSLSDQLAVLSAQLEPFIAQVAPLSEAIGSALRPLWETVDAEITPQLQNLLALLGPYINQVDLATAFQVIGPLAPTVLKLIPTLNKLYDSIDVIAPLRDPITCPIARAVPQQNLLDIVVPFLCYDTIGPPAPVNNGTPAATPPGPSQPPPAEAPTGDTDQEAPLDTKAATEQAAPVTRPLPTPAAGRTSTSATPVTDARSTPVADTGTAPSPIQAIGGASDDRVEALEARLRLMMVLAGGIALLLWNFFHQGSDDDSGGLGAFRRSRSSLPPPVA